MSRRYLSENRILPLLPLYDGRMMIHQRHEYATVTARQERNTAPSRCVLVLPRSVGLRRKVSSSQQACSRSTEHEPAHRPLPRAISSKQHRSAEEGEKASCALLDILINRRILSGPMVQRQVQEGVAAHLGTYRSLSKTHDNKPLNQATDQLLFFL